MLLRRGRNNMKIRWEVSDGYVGKSRTQYTIVDDDEIRDVYEYGDMDEVIEFIENEVHQDFEQTISWDYIDDNMEDEIRKLLKEE